MADERATLTLKLGDREVRYEADREAVEAQLEHLVGRLLREAPADVEVGVAGPPPPAGPDPPPAPPPAAPEVFEARMLKQLYAITGDGHLRLRKLPTRTADALLLVLHGMRKLQDRTWVHAPGMTGAARASGARFERADRLLAGYEDLVEGFGQRRGKRYRLTAAGREHCARLMQSLVGAAAAAEEDLGPAEPAAAEAERPAEAEPTAGGADAGGETVIPEKVTARWDGELWTVAEVARRLGVEEAEVRSLRYRGELVGLPGGTRRRRRYFFPAFQIDAERREIYPQAREANLIVSRKRTSWGIAEWWSSVEPELGRKPMELIGTPEADAMVQAARARFTGRG